MSKWWRRFSGNVMVYGALAGIYGFIIWEGGLKYVLIGVGIALLIVGYIGVAVWLFVTGKEA